MKRGLLLINIGTPSSANIRDVCCYLGRFLTDERVIDIPALIRYLLVYALIIPLRAKKSTHAYKAIWTTQGSPLLFHSQNLVSHLQKSIGSEYKITLGMRYGNPSITKAINDLKECESITILPLYPQYSSATTGSSINEAIQHLTTQEIIPSLNIIGNFYHHSAYIHSQAQIIKIHLHEFDYLLFSYHGIPERQIQKVGCKKVCPKICPPISHHNQGCYKAQCHQTTLLLAKELKLNPNQYSTAFQSRLGKITWTKPYTEEVLIELAAKGIKRLIVTCPSFVTDCLETLEEIGIRAKEQWKRLGGERFTMVPCLNDNPLWVRAIAAIVKVRP